ncbi:MAG: hypothetical protein LBH36_00365 [Candidatus Nomurabacteria bacterium]|jgi:hypothetical protein|nr:hypothetical protein [Candidatus Nomurabacteria bacterium]
MKNDNIYNDGTGAKTPVTPTPPQGKPAEAKKPSTAARKSPSFKKMAIIVAVFCVAIIGTLLVLAYVLPDKRPKDGDVTIGDITITQEKFDANYKEMDEYLDKYPEQRKNYEEGDLADITRKDLIKNAALKEQAKKCGVTIGIKDIAASYGGQTESEDIAAKDVESLFGRKGSFRYVRIENSAYTGNDKLTACTVASKNIFYAILVYDTEWFRGENVDPKQAQASFDAAKARMESEVLPLFKQKLSNDEIMAKADPTPPDEDYGKVIQPPLWSAYETKWSDGYFNDDPAITYEFNVGKMVSVNDATKNLKNVGDHTGVLVGENGAFVIVRYDSKSGDGSYDSWDSFLEEALGKYAHYDDMSVVIASIKHGARSILGKIVGFIVKNVLAASDCDATKTHGVPVYTTITGAGSIDSSTGIICSGSGFIIVSCDELAPTLSARAADGYKYVSSSIRTDGHAKCPGTLNTGERCRWTAGSKVGEANSDAAIHVNVVFEPDVPADSWSLVPSINVNQRVVRPGGILTFTSFIQNTGPSKSNSNYVVDGHVSRSGTANIDGGVVRNNGSNNYTATASDVGKDICATITVTPRAHDNDKSIMAKTCASVIKPDEDIPDINPDPRSGSNSGNVIVTNVTSGGSGDYVIAKPTDLVRWDYTMKVGTFLARPSGFIASNYPGFDNDRGTFSHSCSISGSPGSAGSLNCSRSSNGTTTLNNSVTVNQSHVNTDLKQTMNWDPTKSSISNPSTSYRYKTGSHRECSGEGDEVTCWMVDDYTTVTARYIQRTQTGSGSDSATAHIPVNYDTSVNIKGASYNDNQVFEPGQKVWMGGEMILKKINSGTHLGTYVTRTRGGQYELTLLEIAPGYDNAKRNGKSNSDPCGFYSSQPGLRDCKSLSRGAVPIHNPTGDTDVVDGVEFLIPDGSPLGTKYCFAISVSPAAVVNDKNQENWNNSVPTCIRVGKRPKVQTHNGGISAPGKIYTYVTDRTAAINKDGTASSTRGVFGSWSEYEALSPNMIQLGTLAAFQKPVTENRAALYNRMTFGNVNPSGGDAFGYFKSGPKNSVTDTINYFYSIAKSKMVIGASYSDATILTSNSEESVFNGTGTVTIGGGTVPKGHTAVIYTTGDVNITGNIQYASTTYEAAADIPQVVIISKKNIRIAEGVTRVDAWLIANNESSSIASTIFTCANSGETVKQVLNRINSRVCSNKLTVNGPVYAEKLHLLRTGGAETTSPKDPAEVFNLPPSTYLWAYTDAKKRNIGYAVVKYSIDVPPRY